MFMSSIYQNLLYDYFPLMLQVGYKYNAKIKDYLIYHTNTPLHHNWYLELDLVS